MAEQSQEEIYREKESISYFQKLQSSLGGVLTGLILIPISLLLLWCNEGRSVDEYKTLKEAQKEYVRAPLEKIDSALEGKLVYVSGKVSVVGDVRDPLLGVVVNGVLALRRLVEMYQWAEKCTTKREQKLGGGEEVITECTYEKVWSSSAIDSSNFKKKQGHENPQKIYSQEIFYSPEARLGVYRLNQEQIMKIAQWESYHLEENLISNIKIKTKTSIEGGKLYVGEDPQNPKIGDYRISLEVAYPKEASVIAVLQGDNLVPYVASSGASLSLASAGILPPENLFAEAKRQNRLTTWLLRFLGWLLLFIGLSLIINPLQKLVDFIPLLGSLVGLGLSVAALAVSIVLASLTVALAWLFYRPLLSLAVLIVGLGVYLALGYLKKARSLANTKASS
ncbi:MAG: TMEM43 family protein [Leptospiraceae bacterium]|nr:TMEM43 family protein [Leptospiraceae bacterium]MDW8306147.1 TMEM43 family protein [Leptospiraceae bacterium]